MYNSCAASFTTFSTIFLFIVLLNANSASSKDAKLTDFPKAISDVKDLLDAYNRDDYVMVLIKLIDIMLKVDPPDLDSARLIQVLILRRFLIKIHPTYIYWNPRKRPTKPHQKLVLPDNGSIETVSEAVNVLDTISKGASEGIGDVLKIGMGLVNALGDSSDQATETTTRAGVVSPRSSMSTRRTTASSGSLGNGWIITTTARAQVISSTKQIPVDSGNGSNESDDEDAAVPTPKALNI